MAEPKKKRHSTPVFSQIGGAEAMGCSLQPWPCALLENSQGCPDSISGPEDPFQSQQS
jgi:hypothetical protein